MSEKLATVEYRQPRRAGAPFAEPGFVEILTDTYPGCQLRVEGHWLVVSGLHGDVAFFPLHGVIRAWNTPASR